MFFLSFSSVLWWVRENRWRFYKALQMLTPFGARTPGWMCYFLLEWFLNATVVQKRNYPLFQHLLFHSLSLSLGGMFMRWMKAWGWLAIITRSARVAILCFERPTGQSSTNMGVFPSCIAKWWCRVSLGEVDVCSDGYIGYFRRAELVRKSLWEQGGMGWHGVAWVSEDLPFWWSLPLQQCSVQLRIAGGVWF